jgi:hypothetical protein
MDVFDILDLISGFGSRKRSDSCPKRRKSSLHYLEEKRGYSKEGEYPPLFSLSDECKHIFDKLVKYKTKYQPLLDVYAIVLGQFVSHTDIQEDKDNIKEEMFTQRLEDLSKYCEVECKERDMSCFILMCEHILKKEFDKMEEDRELYYYTKDCIKKENEEFCRKYLYILNNNVSLPPGN